MLDLRECSGLPISLDDRGLLVFDPEERIVVEERGVRLLDALTPVVLEPDIARGSTEVAYYMDNGVYHRRDADRLAGCRCATS